MKIIEPTHEQIMKYLNCCYYGYYNKTQCQCNNPRQFKSCYENAKKQLTYTEYTEEEIAEMKRKSKETNQTEEAFKVFWDFIESN